MAEGGDSTMSILVSGSKVREAIEGQTFIIDGTPSAAEAVKYDFHMGSRILKAELGQPLDLAEIAVEKRWVMPGEVVFVLTREKVRLPRNMIALLSPKRKLAHRGIMALGGLAVDPEYKGVLVVGLYNFSSTPFALQPDIRIIAASFYELGENELVQFPVAPPQEITDFPAELVSMIRSYKPIELTALQEELKVTRQEIVTLRTEFMTDKSWKDEFKSGLTGLQQTVSETSVNLKHLASSLEKESTLRAQEDRVITERINKQSNLLFGFNLFWAAAILVVVAILGALADHYVPKAFGWDAPQTQTKTH
jgi:deoxycytidine triphosphate deaminase